MSAPFFSIVVPAHNEERLIGRCLGSIRAAAASAQVGVEIIVVLNRCTDRTDEIACGFGAWTLRDDSRNLSRIRNAGARAAQGRILVTIDADSAMSSNALGAIDRALSGGRVVGGGTRILPDRDSAGIRFTCLCMEALLRVCRLAGGMFWCRREDFEAVGGFDESMITGEDLDFARRLKAFGRQTGRRFLMLPGAHIITSCRKFDVFGDWMVVRHPLWIWRIFRGRNRRIADVFYYDFEN